MFSVASWKKLFLNLTGGIFSLRHDYALDDKPNFIIEIFSI